MPRARGLESLKSLLLEWLKVPAEPQPPAGSPGSIRVFRASHNYYRLQLIKWVFSQISVVVGILAFLVFWHSLAPRQIPNAVRYLVGILELFGVVSFLIQLPVTLWLVRLDYEMRWYMVSDRSLRIRSGILNVSETTLTFANIQQITVEQGPLQRLLGISDLRVTTAGGGEQSAAPGRASTMHCGFFHGIDNAPQVKELMQERLRLLRDSGLGDPEEGSGVVLGVPQSHHEALVAARELLQEAKRLRLLLTETPARPEGSGTGSAGPA